ncbi:MAG: tRNA (adenosine(37)-N6)-threonylcarbamoyltransferase complex dimerization subunit type 1 TsaB [Bacteroidales bacterium]
MPTIIHIETSTEICSVALSHHGEVIFNKENHDGFSHATHLGLFLESAVRFAEEQGYGIDAVAVSCGPGSYTGLRIGVSTAKGFCYGRNIPLISIPTPIVLAQAILQKEMTGKATVLCPMLDARRMEVYAAMYDLNLNPVREISAEIIDENSFAEERRENTILFFGNGAEKCKEALEDNKSLFLEDIHPLAKYMVVPAEEKFKKKEFEDIAYFEPFYLKEFVATTAKNKVLGF